MDARPNPMSPFVLQTCHSYQWPWKNSNLLKKPNPRLNWFVKHARAYVCRMPQTDVGLTSVFLATGRMLRTYVGPTSALLATVRLPQTDVGLMFYFL